MLATRSRVVVALLVLGFLATTPANAWAYVDPGTGSYFFQLGAAGFFAAIFTLRRCWTIVKAWCTGGTTMSGGGDPTGDLHE